jgi:hypothetical protein
MESKRATKEPSTRICRIAAAMKANTHEITNINFARQLASADSVSVIPVPLASSVICVVTDLQEWASTRSR